MSQRIASNVEAIDITAGNHDIASTRVGSLHAVAGSGKVKLTTRGGTTTTIYLQQGQVFDIDAATIVKVGTDAVFASAAGDLLALINRYD